MKRWKSVFGSHFSPDLDWTFVVVLSLLLVSGFIAYLNIQQDDSYIYYSYVQNIVAGEGYVFNPGERINATTSPLYTLLLALLFKMFGFIPFLDIPAIGHLISLVSLMALSLLLVKIFRNVSPDPFALVLPLVLLSSPFLPHSVGMEMFLAIMLGTSSIHYYTTGKLNRAALASSLSVLARPDMALLAAVVLGHRLFVKRERLNFRLILIFLLPISAWAVFSKLYFGQFLPSTLAAKLGQTTSGRWGEGLIFFKGVPGGIFGYDAGEVLATTLFLWGCWHCSEIANPVHSRMQFPFN